MIQSSSQNICSREQKDSTTAETYSPLNYLRLYLTKLYNTKRTVTIAITQYNICFFCGSSNTCTKASRVIATAESPGSLVVKARSVPSWICVLLLLGPSLQTPCRLPVKARHCMLVNRKIPLQRWCVCQIMIESLLGAQAWTLWLSGMIQLCKEQGLERTIASKALWLFSTSSLMPAVTCDTAKWVWLANS